MKNPLKSDYYVYVLFDADGIPRYVGKGRGRRWKQHEGEIKSRNRIKNKFVRETLAKLREIPKIKVRENLSEPEAFATEVALIAAIGRRDLSTGPLTNMSAGGTGGDFGEAIRRTKAKWTPEKRATVGRKYSQIMKDFWASMTEAERAAFQAKLNSASLAARKRLQESDPEYEARRAESVSKGHARRTPEEKAVAAAKALISFPPEQRSQTARDFHATQTPEERSRRVKGSLTPEQLSERGRRAAAARDPAARSEQIRRQQDSLTEEQQERRADRARRMANNNTGRRWITDGQSNRRMVDGEELPSGWYYGQTKVYKPRTARSKDFQSSDPETSNAPSATTTPG